MYLKKQYNFPKGWVRKVNIRDPLTKKLLNPRMPEGACLNAPPVKALLLAHTGTQPEQNFSTKFVREMGVAGLLRIEGDKLELRTKAETLIYTIKRHPGLYCCHCDELLHGQVEARAHVNELHSGTPSPDKENPSGYMQANQYDCVLDSAQHERLKAKGPGKHYPFSSITGRRI